MRSYIWKPRQPLEFVFALRHQGSDKAQAVSGKDLRTQSPFSVLARCPTHVRDGSNVRRGVKLWAYCFGALLLCWVHVAVARPPEGIEKYDSKRLPQISLVTIGQGSSAVDSFGQTALRVQIEESKTDEFYTFCIPDMAGGNALRAVVGKPTYRLKSFPYARAAAHYKQIGRELVVQPLTLTIDGAYDIAEALASPEYPARSGYALEFFTSNCTTKVRDLINAAIDGRLASTWTSKDPQTWREHALRMVADSYVAYLALDFLLGARADKHATRWETAFLPQTLQRAVEGVRFHGVHGSASLVRETNRVGYGPREQIRQQAPDRTAEILRGSGIATAFVLVLGSLAFGGGRMSRVAFALLLGGWGLVMGLLGSASLVLGLFSSQPHFEWNLNVLAGGPWALGIVWLSVGVGQLRREALQRAFVLSSVCAAGTVLAWALARIPSVSQDNARTVALCLPLWTAFAYSLFVLRYPHFSVLKLVRRRRLGPDAA